MCVFVDNLKLSIFIIFPLNLNVFRGPELAIVAVETTHMTSVETQIPQQN